MIILPGPSIVPKLAHLGKLFSEHGHVSPLCAPYPKPLDLRRQSWVLDERAVTCRRCIKAMGRRHQVAAAAVVDVPVNASPSHLDSLDPAFVERIRREVHEGSKIARQFDLAIPPPVTRRQGRQESAEATALRDYLLRPAHAKVRVPPERHGQLPILEGDKA